MLVLATKLQKKSVTQSKVADFFHSKVIFLALQAFYGHALVGFYVLNNLLVVVVCAASHKVKL